MTFVKRRALAATVAGTVLATSALARSARESHGAFQGGSSMLGQTTNLFLVEDLNGVGAASKLAESDLSELRAVADWTKTFAARPHSDLGRAGPVCPFVSVALDRRTLWFAAERSAGRSAPDVIRLIEG